MQGWASAIIAGVACMVLLVGQLIVAGHWAGTVSHDLADLKRRLTRIEAALPLPELPARLPAAGPPLERWRHP